MFNQLGWSEVAVLVVAAIFIFGPERLPKLAADAGRTVRRARTLLAGVQEDLRSDFGPEIADLDLRTLRPKTLVQQMLFADDPDSPATHTARPFGTTPKTSPAPPPENRT